MKSKPKPGGKSAPEKPELTRKQRLIFTAVMVLIPFAFFGLLEGALRIAGYGEDYPLFVPMEGKEEYLYQNRQVARRYFSRIRQVPTGLLDFFKAEKDSSTFRIFVQGGSTAAGFPYYYGGSFSRMLEQRLLQTFPGRAIEVINTSMSAVNSFTLLDLVEEILEQKPDLVLIYAGHNEYYGALGVGSIEQLGGAAWLVRTYLRLIDWRTVQLIRNVLSGAAGLLSGQESNGEPTGTLMERMVGRQRIPYGTALYRQGEEQFRSNLRTILKRYRERGIPVLIGTLASNERHHRPFISGHADGVDLQAWQAAYDRGVEALERGDLEVALAALDEAAQIDSLSAETFYTRATVLDSLGRYEEARADYLRAKDRDELRFRAPESFNRIIREEAERAGAVVVDVQAALAEASPGGIIGSELMLEHLHPNVEGYLRIADAYYRAMKENSLIGAWEKEVPLDVARSEILLTPVDSMVGMLRLRQLKARWPFQPPGVVDRSADSIRVNHPVEKLAVDLYLNKLNWREANEALRQYYEATGDYHRALQATLVHIQEYPFIPSGYLAAGNNLIKQGRYDEALAYFEAANDLEESSPAQTMIGSILLRRGEHEKAIEHLGRAVALDPENEQALYNLSGAYALVGRIDEARRTAERLLEVDPDHDAGKRLLAGLPVEGAPTANQYGE